MQVEPDKVNPYAAKNAITFLCAPPEERFLDMGRKSAFTSYSTSLGHN